MKTTKKLNRKHFRYLTNKDIKNPLVNIAEFCRSWTSLEGYLDDVKSIICANRSRDPEKLSTMEQSNLLFEVKLTLTNIELLYVLQHTIDSWKLGKNSPYYTLKTTAMGAYIEDVTLPQRQKTLLFEQLTKAETKNIGKFIKKFFRVLTLREWQRLMDHLQEDFFTEDDLSSLIMYQDNFKKIFKYLKKLPEAIFFIYATKAKEYIFKHYVAEFRLETFLKEEATEQSGEEALESELAQETGEADTPTENPRLANDS